MNFNELPAVVCTLIFAAVLAACISTIDCGLITLCTVITRDIRQGAAPAAIRREAF